jgi:hypothetical protein
MYKTKSKCYAGESINHLNILFGLDVDNIESIKEKVCCDYGLARRTNNSFRTFLNYLEKNTGFDTDILEVFRKFILGGVDSGLDEYNENNVSHLENGISYYKLFWLRGNKNSYYLFFRTETLIFLLTIH